MNNTNKRINIFGEADENKLKAMFEYAEDYKKFLDNSKTERDATKTAVAIAESCGYKPFSFKEHLKPGDKRYFANCNKNLYLIKIGTEDIEENGIRIMGAHVDSPRLDLKPNPLYEDSGLCLLKTHYYGGIKKYQWTTIPLALHGVVVVPGGEVVNVNIGEDENDPVFYITDLLPHLAQEQMEKSLAKGVEAERLNAVIGGMPLKGEEKDALKANILKLLNQKYGIDELDLMTSELSLVPAGKSRDVGLDRAFICGYGHDDKVCAYPEFRAILESGDTHTIMAIFSDKEETGSDGITGAQSRVFMDVIDTICSSLNANPIIVRSNSFCLSADVCSALDPTYPEAYEKRNASLISSGTAVRKYTGARGKSSTNDASAETIGRVRDILDSHGIYWQAGELGKTDLGGGGTIAKYVSMMGIPTIDIGVPMLSMHAPLELISKADLYETYLAMCAFCD